MMIQAKILATALAFTGMTSLATPVPTGAEFSLHIGPLEATWSGHDVDFAIVEACPSTACPLMELHIEILDGPDWRIRV